jgi:Wiskott-Aldrich syndrome protein
MRPLPLLPPPPMLPLRSLPPPPPMLPLRSLPPPLLLLLRPVPLPPPPPLLLLASQAALAAGAARITGIANPA